MHSLFLLLTEGVVFCLFTRASSDSKAGRRSPQVGPTRKAHVSFSPFGNLVKNIRTSLPYGFILKLYRFAKDVLDKV